MYSNHLFFFFKQKTAYEMRISDWSSDVCSSDLIDGPLFFALVTGEDDVAELLGPPRVNPADAAQEILFNPEPRREARGTPYADAVPLEPTSGRMEHILRPELGPHCEFASGNGQGDARDRASVFEDRKSVELGKSGSVLCDLGGGRNLKKKKN